ncbi:MAG: hypothetical protein NW226_11230 [Microscillaceae bacterium]|nr:hypothetical protein [Microscillaceae bacterium]
MFDKIPENYYYEGIGWLGALLFLVSYAFLITGQWKSTQAIYHMFNLLGGIFLVINTCYFGSWSATFINAVWALIALYGLFKDKHLNFF